MATRVTTAARLHFGFLNLSLSRERLYGSLGVALSDPKTVVRVRRADVIDAPDEETATYAQRAVEILDVPGASVEVDAAIPRHVGLGSGTQLALAVYVGVAGAYGVAPAVREAAPALDRGGRSGVGVATFESGGFVVDAGHPAERFTTDRPPRGQWSVPGVLVRHAVPPDWRFVVAIPDVSPGQSGDEEDESMRAVVEAADPDVADAIDALVLNRLLPAIVEGDRETFGRSVAELGRLNGVWYAREQGGLYRPPIGAVVEALSAAPAVTGAGQSSWGPSVYAVTDREHADAAAGAAGDALSSAGLDGDVMVVEPRNAGAQTASEGE